MTIKNRHKIIDFQKSIVEIIICILTILTILSSFSCRANDKKKFVFVQSYNIPIDTRTSNYSFCLKPSVSSYDYLYMLKDYSNTIIRIDLSKESIAEEIVINNEGPNSVPNLGGFTIYSDHYFLESIDRPSLYLADTNWIIKNKIKYGIDIDDYTGSYVPLISRYKLDIIEDDTSIYIPQHFNTFPGKLDKAGMSKHPLFLRYDKNLEEFSRINIRMPQDFFVEGDFPTYFTIDGGPTKAYISFAYNENCGIIDLQKKSVDYKKVKSKYIHQLLSYGKIGNPVNYSFLAPKYGNIFYDKQNEVVYRFARHSNLDYQEEITFEKGKYIGDFSIIVMDENLNVIDEILFDENKYVLDNSFFWNGGILLSKNNPYHEKYKENEIRFDYYKWQ